VKKVRLARWTLALMLIAFTVTIISHSSVSSVCCSAKNLVANQQQSGAGLERKSDFEIESNPLIVDFLYRRPPASAYQSISETGASSINAKWELQESPSWFIEAQRSGEYFIINGLVRNDSQAIQTGFKIFDWGFEHQAEDGSFPGSSGFFHSTSFFVQAIAHSLLIVQQSPQAKKYASQVEFYKPLVHRAAKWMIRADVWNRGTKGNVPYAHRRYLVAAALGLTGKLTGDQELVQYSRQSLEDGLSIQRPDGVNPEKEGYDSSYQAVGLVYAQRWAMYFPNDALTPRVVAMVNRGLDWAEKTILPSGEVSNVGNTRTGGQETGISGRAKNVDYKMVFRGFAYWGLVTGNQRWLELAQRISAFY
jgi:hypothetical protein